MNAADLHRSRLSRTSDPGEPPAPTPCRARQNFTPAPQGFCSGRPPSSASIPGAQSHPPPQTTSPVTLVIGDSFMKHVRKRSAETLFFPGIKVADIQAKIPGLLAKYPSSRNVVIHVGYNDVSNQTSEILKQDFSRLL